MSDIFDERLIYPLREKYKTYFKNYYDSIFVAFMPFFKIEDEDFKEGWPTDQEIYESGTPVSWNTVIKGAGLKDEKELNKALVTSYGAPRHVFQRDDLFEKLLAFEEDQNIWRPKEDSFGIFSKISIYESLKFLGKNDVLFTDHNLETQPTSLNDCTSLEFSEETRHCKVIYSADKDILFTIYWDQPFFLIATSKSNLDVILKQGLFEGFVCNDETDGLWDYEKEELAKLFEEDKIWQQEMLKYRNAGVFNKSKPSHSAVPSSDQSTKPAPLPKDWWKFWKGLF